MAFSSSRLGRTGRGLDVTKSLKNQTKNQTKKLILIEFFPVDCFSSVVQDQVADW